MEQMDIGQTRGGQGCDPPGTQLAIDLNRANGAERGNLARSNQGGPEADNVARRIQTVLNSFRLDEAWVGWMRFCAERSRLYRSRMSVG